MNRLQNFVVSLLNDDHGLSENGYEALLLHVLEDNQDAELFDALKAQVKAADGRYYLPEDCKLVMDIS